MTRQFVFPKAGQIRELNVYIGGVDSTGYDMGDLLLIIDISSHTAPGYVWVLMNDGTVMQISFDYLK